MVNDAMQALFKRGRAEVDEQTYRQVEQSKVGQDLLGMDRGQVLDGLKLYDDRILYEEVYPEAFVEMEAFKLERHWPLPLDRQTAPFQLGRQHRLIDRFEQARSKPSMELIRRVDDLPGYLLNIPHSSLRALRVSA
jgi:hypothetical protein